MSIQNKSKKKIYIIDALIILFCTAIDYLTKLFAYKRLKDHPAISLIPGKLEIRYLANTGAAFGLLKNQKAFFILITSIVILTCLYLIIRLPAKKRFNLSHGCLSMILAGALGNLIDRVIYGHVIDFIYFSLVKFPIFNFADIYVTIGTLIFVILLLFIYKEDDLNFLKFMEKRIRDIE